MGKNIYIGVDNVARKVKQPFIGVDNIARKVKNGFIGVDNVARQFYQGGTPISSIAVGTSVYLKESGTSQEYIIINQGIPSGSSLYDSSCNGVWLTRKDIFACMPWDSYADSGATYWGYDISSIHAYLNSTFLSLLDANIQSTIKQVKIPYWDGVRFSSTVLSGANGLSTKVFLLSATEVQLDDNDGTVEVLKEGANISYFSSPSNRLARWYGTPTYWFLRSRAPSNIRIATVDGDGYVGGASCSKEYGIRPTLIMPFDITVDENMNIIV